jgi:hypothetical protein
LIHEESPSLGSANREIKIVMTIQDAWNRMDQILSVLNDFGVSLNFLSAVAKGKGYSLRMPSLILK